MVDGGDARRLTLIADLVEQLPTAVAYLHGPQHTFEFVNDAYQRLIGRREVGGLPVLEALPEMAGRRYSEILDGVLTTGNRAEVHEVELHVGTPDGEAETVYADFLYQPVTDDDGSVVGILVHAADVTSHVLDRRRLERLADELTEAQERYRRLFETMPDGVVYHGADGAIIAANPRAAEILGVDHDDLIGSRPDGPRFQAVYEDGSDFPGQDHPVSTALRTGEIVADVVMGVKHGVTGERRWLAVTAVPDAPDEAGRPQRAYAMFKDITEERKTTAALRDRDSLLGRLRDANVLGIAVADERRILDANDAFLRMIGYTEEDRAAGRIDWRAITPPEWADRDEVALGQLRENGASEPFEKEFIHVSGRRVPVMLGGAVVEREPLRWVTFVADLSDRQRAEEERVQLVASAQLARTEAENAEERLGLLLRASAVVAATDNRDDLLKHLTRLLVPAVADFAAVFVPGEDGSLHATAAEHRDPGRTDVLAKLDDHAVPADSTVALQAAYRTGQSQLVREVGTRPKHERLDPVVVEVAGGSDTDSVLAVPLMAVTGPVGVLWLGRNRGRAPFAESDVAVAEELARRLVVGVVNADVFAREHTVAEMLQRSVLPDVLPAVPGLDVSVVYLPATEGVDVGGDWYDAFPLGPGLLGIVLGDVVGHNLASASAMNQVRNALRAYAADDPRPAVVMRRTNSALARLMPEVMATVIYGVLDVETGELTYTNAGHPPPLVAGPDRPGFLTEAGGLMLGVADDTEYDIATHRLTPASALLLYSDGLVEDKRRSIDEGLDDLARAFVGYDLTSAEDVCVTAQTALLESPARADDICLLAVRLVR